MGFAKKKLISAILLLSVVGFMFSIIELHYDAGVQDTLQYTGRGFRRHKMPLYNNDIEENIVVKKPTFASHASKSLALVSNVTLTRVKATDHLSAAVDKSRAIPPVIATTKASKRKVKTFPADHGKLRAVGPLSGTDKCSGDCARLRDYLQSLPESKPKAVFYTLTQGSRAMRLQQMLSTVEKYFNKQYKYPFVIFHEPEFKKYVNNLRKFSNMTLYFQEISFSIPEFLNKPVEYNIPCLSSIGYRHMCRFHVKTVFEEPIMNHVEYYWRLDDDSLITNPVNYDVFKYMKKEQLSYGYIWKHYDSAECTTGLWNATRDYIKSRNLHPEFFDEWREPRLFYNNFELSKTDIWKSHQYHDYADYIDHLGGIYYHRWGDAPIKGLALSLFLPSRKIHHFKDIGYRHNTFVNIPS